MTGKNRIMIYGPKDDGTYVIAFRTAEGDVLAISIPRSSTSSPTQAEEPPEDPATGASGGGVFLCLLTCELLHQTVVARRQGSVV